MTLRGMMLGAVCAVALAACSSSSPDFVHMQFSSGTPTPQVTLPSGVPAMAFNVGVAVAGAPDPHSIQFLTDQEKLYDASQFNDSNFYPQGYHWRIDTGIGPHGIAHCTVVYDSQQAQWAMEISFTPAAAIHWSADTTAAYHANPNSALNRIAVFVGPRVVWAPQVQSPSSNATEITNDFTQQQAATTCAAILAGARQ
jgi:sugar lactone lactonase YvrE